VLRLPSAGLAAGLASSLAAVLALLIGPSAAPARADSYVHDDHTSDVVAVELDGSGEECDVCQGTDRPDVDVLRFGADYAQQLRLSLTMADVARRTQVVWVVRFGPEKWLTLGVTQTRAGLRCTVVRSGDPESNDDCGDIEVSLDRARNTFHAVLPAHWAGAAGSVKVGAGAAYFGRTRAYVDDGSRNRFDLPGQGLVFTVGPSIPRG
jgi:hypothetical protein